MKCIWVLTELYYPDRTSTAYFVSKTAQGLAENFEVKVLTGGSLYESKSISLPFFEIIQGVEVQRCLSTSFDKNWLPGRIINGLTRAIAIFWQALWQCHASDVVLVVTNPPLLPLMAWLLKILKGCDFVLLVHDVYPEVLSVSGLAHSQSMIYRLVQGVNLLIYQQAKRVITLGRDMQKLVVDKLTPSVDGKVVCIPHWAETEIIYPVDKQDSSLLQRLNLVNKFVVLYAGNMGRTHDLQILLDAAEALIDTQPHIHFLLIGAGAQKQAVEARVQDQQLHNVTVLSYLPHAEKNVTLNSCDVGVISFLPGMVGVSVPSRMYNQMAAGKPLIAIADHESELAQVICEEGIGWLIPPQACDQLVRLLTQIAEEPDTCLERGRRAAKAVQNQYLLNHAVNKYRSLFQTLIPLAKISESTETG